MKKMPKLAIEGGDPVRDKLLPYGHQYIDEADIQAVVEVLRGEAGKMAGSATHFSIKKKVAGRRPMAEEV